MREAEVPSLALPSSSDPEVGHIPGLESESDSLSQPIPLPKPPPAPGVPTLHLAESESEGLRNPDDTDAALEELDVIGEEDPLAKSSSFFSVPKKRKRRGWGSGKNLSKSTIGSRLCPPRPAELPSFTFIKKNEGFGRCFHYCQLSLKLLGIKLDTGALGDRRREGYLSPETQGPWLIDSVPPASLSNADVASDSRQWRHSRTRTSTWRRTS